jgi:hypothetical protein
MGEKMMALAERDLRSPYRNPYQDLTLSQSRQHFPSASSALPPSSLLMDDPQPSVKVAIELPEEGEVYLFSLNPRLLPVVERLAALEKLEENWSSYGSKQIKRRALVDTLKFLTALDDTAPIPSIVPTFSGGIQIEWNYAENGIEVEWVGANKFEYYSELDGVEDEGVWDIESDYNQVKQYIHDKLSALSR